eukprot:335757-Chlamydomonas_euryale.AAC.1
MELALPAAAAPAAEAVGAAPAAEAVGAEPAAAAHAAPENESSSSTPVTAGPPAALPPSASSPSLSSLAAPSAAAAAAAAHAGQSAGGAADACSSEVNVKGDAPLTAAAAAAAAAIATAAPNGTGSTHLQLPGSGAHGIAPQPPQPASTPAGGRGTGAGTAAADPPQEPPSGRQLEIWSGLQLVSDSLPYQPNSDVTDRQIGAGRLARALVPLAPHLHTLCLQCMHITACDAASVMSCLPRLQELLLITCTLEPLLLQVRMWGVVGEEGVGQGGE